MDILLSGRKFDAAEAARLGVVNRTIEHDRLLEHARDYLTSLATHSAPRSLQTMKHQVYKHLDASLGDAMRESLRLMEESLTRDDFKEGVASYVEKTSAAVRADHSSAPDHRGSVLSTARPSDAGGRGQSKNDAAHAGIRM